MRPRMYILAALACFSLVIIEAVRVDEDDDGQAKGKNRSVQQPEQSDAQDQTQAQVDPQAPADGEAQEDDTLTKESNVTLAKDPVSHESCGKWEKAPHGMGDLRGVGNVHYRFASLDECRCRCNADEKCKAVKWSPTAPKGNNCWFFYSVWYEPDVAPSWEVHILKRPNDHPPTPAPTPMPTALPTCPPAECDTTLLGDADAGQNRLAVASVARCDVGDTVEIGGDEVCKIASVDEGSLRCQKPLLIAHKRTKVVREVCGFWHEAPGNIPGRGDVQLHVGALKECRCSCFKDPQCKAVKWSALETMSNCNLFYSKDLYKPEAKPEGFEVHVLDTCGLWEATKGDWMRVPDASSTVDSEDECKCKCFTDEQCTALKFTKQSIFGNNCQLFTDTKVGPEDFNPDVETQAEWKVFQLSKRLQTRAGHKTAPRFE